MNIKSNNLDDYQNESIYSGYPNEDNYRKDLVNHIKNTDYKDMKKISSYLNYGLSSYDLIRLLNEYKKENKEFNKKVEYLLNDINFHDEYSMLMKGKVDKLIEDSKSEIRKNVETYVLDKFINEYKNNGNSGYLSKKSNVLDDVSVYDCLYLIDKGYLEEYANGYTLTDSYISTISKEKTIYKSDDLEDREI